MKPTSKMRPARKRLQAFVLLLLTLYPFQPGKAYSEVLAHLVLKGKQGGLSDGSQWSSDTLKNRVNLVFYVDPDKQSWIKPLVTRLDTIRYAPEVLGQTFILNTDATIIPDFILIRKVRERAKEQRHITYVLDRDKVLVKKWNLADNSVNVLLLDKAGRIVQKYTGKISDEIGQQIIHNVDQLINKGDEQ